VREEFRLEYATCCIKEYGIPASVACPAQFSKNILLYSLTKAVTLRYCPHDVTFSWSELIRHSTHKLSQSNFLFQELVLRARKVR
jgi:hypothetical protein